MNKLRSSCVALMCGLVVGFYCVGELEGSCGSYRVFVGSVGSSGGLK